MDKNLRQLFAEIDQCVATSIVNDRRVSTISLRRPGLPLPYRVMVYEIPSDVVLPDYTEHYATLTSALAGHDQIVAELRYLASLQPA